MKDYEIARDGRSITCNRCGMMRVPPSLEPHRLRSGKYGSDPGDLWGSFVQVQGPCAMVLTIMATPGYTDETLPSDADHWEHVSVSGRRLPNWTEMSFVRDLFWTEDAWVVQFHPARSEYVNHHPNCLHLWRYKGGFPTPPSILVGPKEQAEGPIGPAEAQKKPRGEPGL